MSERRVLSFILFSIDCSRDNRFCRIAVGIRGMKHDCRNNYSQYTVKRISGVVALFQLRINETTKYETNLA